MSMLELNSWTFSEEQDFVFVVVRGEDAENFLQGMLTQNVKTMGPTDARWTAACNHQGRTAATSLIVRIPNGFGMLMPKSIAQDEVDRLSKFILKSKFFPNRSPISAPTTPKLLIVRARPFRANRCRPMSVIPSSLFVFPPMTHKACTANSWLSARSLMTCTLRSKHTTAWLAL